MSANEKLFRPWLQGIPRICFFCALALTAAGCGASRPVKYYVLSSEATPRAVYGAPSSSRFPVTLLVARIRASHLYRDDRLVYGSGPVELGTYEYQRWAEPPAEMVQDSLIAALRATGDYRSVSAIGSNLRGDYILRGRLDAIDEVDKPEISARFSIELELVDSKTELSVWTEFYSHDEPVKGKTVSEVVEALDRNVSAAMQQFSASLAQYFTSHPPSVAASSH